MPKKSRGRGATQEGAKKRSVNGSPDPCLLIGKLKGKKPFVPAETPAVTDRRQNLCRRASPLSRGAKRAWQNSLRPIAQSKEARFMEGKGEKELLVWLNGELVAKSQAKISVYDHGLLYGDGVFEGIRAYNGRVFMLDEHIDRLYDSAKAIWLTIPLTKEQTASSHLANAAGEWASGRLHPRRRHQRCRRLGLRPAQVPPTQCHHHHRPH
jgi:hypothetical protein